jgi:hypothetical protein
MSPIRGAAATSHAGRSRRLCMPRRVRPASVYWLTQEYDAPARSLWAGTPCTADAQVATGVQRASLVPSSADRSRGMSAPMVPVRLTRHLARVPRSTSARERPTSSYAGGLRHHAIGARHDGGGATDPQSTERPARRPASATGQSDPACGPGIVSAPDREPALIEG